VKLRADLLPGVATHPGLQRSGNEDDYLVLAAPGNATADAGTLFAIADGMGGVVGGAEASRTALRALGAGLLAADAVAPADRMQAAFAVAAAAVHQLAREVPALRDMGTTLTAALVVGRHAVLGHVGDSRALLLRGGRLQQLTTDHAVREPDNYLTRCIGGGQGTVQPDWLAIDLQIGDRLVLLTDGVWSTVPPAELSQLLGQGEPQLAADRLVQAANHAGGPDNATALVVQLLAGGAEKAHEVALQREESSRAGELPGGRGLLPPRWPWWLLLLAGLVVLLAAARALGGFDALQWLRAHLSL